MPTCLPECEQNTVCVHYFKYNNVFMFHRHLQRSPPPASICWFGSDQMTPSTGKVSPPDI